MPRALPQYVYRQRTRHGRVVFYFRKGKCERTRLPAPGSPGFEQRYHRILAGLRAPETPKRGAAGSLEWLIAQYQQASAYAALAPATRRQRDNIFKGVIAKAGHLLFRAITA